MKLLHFHHKNSGLKIWWYKHVNRDIKIEDPNNVCSVCFVDILKECLDSIPINDINNNYVELDDEYDPNDSSVVHYGLKY